MKQFQIRAALRKEEHGASWKGKLVMKDKYDIGSCNSHCISILRFQSIFIITKNYYFITNYVRSGQRSSKCWRSTATVFRFFWLQMFLPGLKHPLPINFISFSTTSVLGSNPVSEINTGLIEPGHLAGKLLVLIPWQFSYYLKTEQPMAQQQHLCFTIIILVLHHS